MPIINHFECWFKPSVIRDMLMLNFGNDGSILAKTQIKSQIRMIEPFISFSEQYKFPNNSLIPSTKLISGGEDKYILSISIIPINEKLDGDLHSAEISIRNWDIPGKTGEVSKYWGGARRDTIERSKYMAGRVGSYIEVSNNFDSESLGRWYYDLVRDKNLVSKHVLDYLTQEFNAVVWY